jgi:hypothetical protein
MQNDGSPSSPTARILRRRGTAKVGVWVRFTGPAGVRQLSRLVRLERDG